jgi:hypothetical protein
MADLPGDFLANQITVSGLLENGYSSGLVYRMRGYSASLGYYVWWWADFIDSGYTEYAGPGTPLTSVVVFSIN